MQTFRGRARRRRAICVLAAAGCCAAAVPAIVSAYSSFGSPVTGQTVFLSSLPGSATSGAGPNGIFDDGTHVFVADAANGTMYRFGENGGSASSSSTLQVADGLTNGIAKLGGVYYAGSRGIPGVDAGLYSFDPATLARGREVASLGKINEILADPRTGDLYVTTFTNGLYRVENPASSDPSTFEVAVGDFHGIGMTSDGSDLWISNVYVGGPSVEEYTLAALDAVSPTSGCAPSAPNSCAQPVQSVSLAGESPQLPTGLIVMPAGAKIGKTNVSNNVIVNTSQGDTDLPGEVLRVDTNAGDAVSVVAAGDATRGDAATLDSHGYLEMTQTYSVDRLQPAMTPVLASVGFPRRFAPRKGGALSFLMSQAADVKVVIRQTVKGRRSHGKCSARAAKGAHCTVTTTRATHSFEGVPGANRVQIKTSKLKAGKYTLSVTASEGADATSKTTSVKFTLT